VRLFRRGPATSTLDLLVAGLGNPGREYAQTRHDGTFRAKFDGRLAELRIDGSRIAVLKPETYMNESGRSIAAAVRFFKVDPLALLVVHDDVDLDEGRLQVRAGGGLAGHNGLRSIAQTLGTHEFLRLRIGVGRPGRGDPRPVADWVLSPFAPETDVEALVGRSADAVRSIAVEGSEAAQRAFN
jgi:PTH1 family peptidyl-tRNA hydrolase